MRNLLLLGIRVSLNVAISVVILLWVLSRWSVVLADIGNNSLAPRGVGFASSPTGIKFSLLDRAWITNGVEIVNVNASPSGWDWDEMQRPYERKLSFLGISAWYRTRQCVVMLATTYSTAIVLLLCIYAIIVRISSRYSQSEPECVSDTA